MSTCTQCHVCKLRMHKKHTLSCVHGVIRTMHVLYSVFTVSCARCVVCTMCCVHRVGAMLRRCSTVFQTCCSRLANGRHPEINIIYFPKFVVTCLQRQRAASGLCSSQRPCITEPKRPSARPPARSLTHPLAHRPHTPSLSLHTRNTPH